ncbi:MAG TPA: DUF3014 domain-containing protein [Steroidobacteraceae bacterium]|nr:DUF3014 domain-containing protein [Steroidobacteraceae bacterium]
MNENFKWIAAAVAVVGLTIGGILYVSRSKKPPAPVAPPVAVTPAPMPAEEPPIKHPLPATEAPEKLPPLAESDQPMQGVLRDLLGNEPVERFVIPEDLVRHIVVTIDNLPEQKVAQRLRPVRPVSGMFVAGGTEDEPVLDAANYMRYSAMVQLFKSTDTARLVAAYQRYYPLFQDAYANLGHPPQYFNDRVIEVIDHLLATPEVAGQPALKRPGVLYEYADPNVESLSAGQKVLIRMGDANAASVKDKLKELRAALAARPAG